jgi:rhodanese-related sulfurtransferase
MVAGERPAGHHPAGLNDGVGGWRRLKAYNRRPAFQARIHVPIEPLQTFVTDHAVLCLGFVGVTVALIGNELSRFTRGYRAIGPAQLTGLINREDALVVDVSPPADFEKGHVIGSRNVAMSQFDPENKQLAKVRELPVALVCRTGVTSAAAAKRLVKAGFKQVYWLDGGVASWQSADLPVARGKS